MCEPSQGLLFSLNSLQWSDHLETIWSFHTTVWHSFSVWIFYWVFFYFITFIILHSVQHWAACPLPSLLPRTNSRFSHQPLPQGRSWTDVCFKDRALEWKVRQKKKQQMKEINWTSAVKPTGSCTLEITIETAHSEDGAESAAFLSNTRLATQKPVVKGEVKYLCFWRLFMWKLLMSVS